MATSAHGSDYQIVWSNGQWIVISDQMATDDADGTNRADVLISDFFITDKMATPQIPVILGSGPIYAPIKDVS